MTGIESCVEEASWLLLTHKYYDVHAVMYMLSDLVWTRLLHKL